MDGVSIGDFILFLGIMGIAGLAAVVTMVTNGITYKKTRRIPPYKR